MQGREEEEEEVGFSSQELDSQRFVLNSMLSGWLPDFSQVNGLESLVISENNLEDQLSESGPHFKPNDFTHGAPDDEVRHAGDLGNIVSNAEGVAEATILDTQLLAEHLWFMSLQMILGRIAMHINEAILQDKMEYPMCASQNVTNYSENCWTHGRLWYYRKYFYRRRISANKMPLLIRNPAGS